MKKHFWILAAALSLAACSPQVYPLHLDVRKPSDAGLTLVGKTATIVYMDGNNAVDSLFDRHAGSALARALEADYFGGEEVIGLSRIPTPDSVGVDLMHSLVMDTGGDVVFVLKTNLGIPAPETNQVVKDATSVDSAFVCPVAVPVKTHLDVYDSMGQDKMNRYTGSAVVPAPKGEGALSQAEVVGERISARFLSKWKTESFSFYYFDQFGSDWEQPIEYVEEGKIGKAIDAWSVLVKKGNSLQRACAAYNMAMAFYLLEDYEMSLLWLDYADKLENVPLSGGLRSRLAPHLEKIQK